MKSFSAILSAAGLAASIVLSGGPAMAQAQAPKQGAAPAQAAQPLKQASAAAMAAAKELLAMKNASAMYQAAVPNIVLSGGPAMAQAQAPKQGAAPAQAAQPLKQASPAAMAAAKELLAMKNASAMYQAAVPNIVEQTKNALIQNNLNYQKDIGEVAVVVAKNLAGREKEIGDGMAQVYANEFSEQELKDLVTFYKTPLGQKLLSTEPRAIQLSMSYMNQWALVFAGTVNEAFRDEMKKRNKPI